MIAVGGLGGGGVAGIHESPSPIDHGVAVGELDAVGVGVRVTIRV
jgi:hypothetical protein